MSFITRCPQCGATVTTSRPAVYCGDGCRSKARHARNAERLAAVQAAAVAHAEAALQRGEPAALAAALRRTIALLNP